MSAMPSSDVAKVTALLREAYDLAIGKTGTSDTLRAKAREAFAAATASLSDAAAGSFARETGRTINAAADYMPVPALIGATIYALEKSPGHAVELISQAITNPDANAHKNSRSKNKFGYGHHNWFPKEVHWPTLATLSSSTNQPSGDTMTATFDINKMFVNIVHAAIIVAQADQEAEHPDAYVPSINEVKGKLAAVAIAAGELHKLSDEQMKAAEAGADIAISGMTDDDMGRFVAASGGNAEAHDIATVITGNKRVVGGDEPEAMQVQAHTINPALLPAVNALMSQASDGKITDFEATLNELAALRAKASQLAKDLSRANARPVIAVSGGEQQVDGEKLTYEVVMRNLADLFRNPKTGRPLGQLKFDVPTLVWKDDKGNVVNHPMTPAIDESYQFRATHVLKLATAFLMNKNVWAHGHTGTGKTTLIEQFYARLGFPAFRVNLDSNLERADLVGQKDLSSQNGATVTTFTQGILPTAMTQPCVLILDEIDAGRPDILFVIQRATEGNGLLLTEDGGRLVRPHPLFRFCATANSRGQGDEFGVYAGVRPMNTAMLDRFGVMIEVDYLAEDEESAFVERAYPSLDKSLITQIVTFAKLVRDAFRNGEISMTLSPRGVKSMIELYTFYEGIMSSKDKAMSTAIEMVVTDRASLDNRQRVLELRERAFK